MIDLTQMSQTCVKCAKCVPSCTIYQINRDETTSPRGFIDLLGAYQKGDLELDKNVKNIFESCFLCTTCTTNCPQVIDTAAMIQQSRVDIAQKYGISWFKRAYFFLLRHRKLMDFVFSLTAFLAPCAFKQNGDKLKSRIPLSQFGKRVVFPFAKRSFLQKHGQNVWIKSSVESSTNQTQNSTKDSKTNSADSTKPINATPRPKVAIFIGCLSNYNYTQVGESLLYILDKLGIDAFIPRQECCGAPAYFTGDIKSVNFLAKKNIELFEEFFNDIDAMLIPEATCAAMIMRDWEHSLSLEGDSWISRLKKLTPKMYLATDYLHDRTNLAEILATKAARVNAPSITYHDPCHAKKVLGVYKEPRSLLGINYNLVEMEECDRCCGFGGVTIQSQKFHLAHNAGIPKAEHIKKSGAKIVSAECSACRMQLNNALDYANVNVAFKHPLELIQEALNG